ncbi:ribose-phosphate pyrophosphokinase [Leptolyngbya sp. KIOST-1]|uniref:ribose-phosphate pyrophosphokinase n=1 Tax=Leptolyngbya sp. KIOST-1 TaxID=1229172 RepID=UPI00068F2C73|nr:ribose-phosphate pyrophosphokinase [Leptolyngbya sp. KIOST-1]
MLSPVILAQKPEGLSRNLPSRLRIFSGSANPGLAQEVAQYLHCELGLMVRKRFADGEIYVQFQESIRGCDVYLMQPTCQPVNDHLLELLIMIDACRRASARQITAVIPYYGYSRADRKTAGRESITAKLTANLITQAGAHRILAMDLHSAQTQGYFDIPVDHIFAAPVLHRYLRTKEIDDVVIVSPDIGGVARARAFAKHLNDAPLAIIDKRRPDHNCADIMNVIGEVNGKTAVIIDDIIDTASTITECARALKEAGASTIYACATHAIFSPPAINRISNGFFEKIIVTNTIPVPQEEVQQLKILSVAELISEAIRRIHKEYSVSSMLQSP